MRSKLIAAGTGAVLVAGVVWTATTVGATTRPGGRPAEFDQLTVNGTTVWFGTPTGPAARTGVLEAARARAAELGVDTARRSVQARPVSAGGVGADLDGDGVGDFVTGNVSDSDEFGVGAGVVISYSNFELDARTHWVLPDTEAAPVLATGDFDNDGFDDLAWGSPDTDDDGAGQVLVLYGSANGAGATEEDVVAFNQTDVNETPEAGDAFGASLAAGDVNGDGFDELIVGVPGEDVAGVSNAGAIHQIPGNVAGLTLAGATFHNQGLPSVPGADEANDRFGFSVAVGEVNGDGFGDVAVGAIGENGVGAVNLLRGSATGISATDATARVALTTATVTPQRLGVSLLIADLTNDGRGEVIAGDPLANVDRTTDSGAVSVWIGRATGLSNTGREWWHQNRANVPGTAEAGDQFGTVLVAGDVLGSSRTDLVVGVPNEDVGTRNRSGTITVLVGASTGTGLTGTGSRGIDQNTTDVGGSPEANDLFGASVQLLAVEGLNLLLVGVPGEQVTNTPGSGALQGLTHTAGEPLDPLFFEDGPSVQLTDESGNTVWAVDQHGRSSLQH